MIRRSRSAHAGFTLLEVMLALTICTIALASLFAVIVENKQLIFRAQTVWDEKAEQYDLISRSLLVDQMGEMLAPVEESDYQVALTEVDDEDPERKTSATTESLYKYEISDEDGNIVQSGTYWVTLEEAE